MAPTPVAPVDICKLNKSELPVELAKRGCHTNDTKKELAEQLSALISSSDSTHDGHIRDLTSADLSTDPEATPVRVTDTTTPTGFSLNSNEIGIRTIGPPNSSVQHLHTKPQEICVNEVLFYLANNIDRMELEPLAQLCSSFFKPDEIARAKSVLSKFCTILESDATIIGLEKETANVLQLARALISVPSENLPVFVTSSTHFPPTKIELTDFGCLAKTLFLMNQELSALCRAVNDMCKSNSNANTAFSSSAGSTNSLGNRTCSGHVAAKDVYTEPEAEAQLPPSVRAGPEATPTFESETTYSPLRLREPRPTSESFVAAVRPKNNPNKNVSASAANEKRYEFRQARTAAPQHDIPDANSQSPLANHDKTDRSYANGVKRRRPEPVVGTNTNMTVFIYRCCASFQFINLI